MVNYMKVRNKKVANRKKIEKLIRATYDSLQSHLPYTYSKKLPTSVESNAFHINCVRSYSQQIKDLADLL